MAGGRQPITAMRRSVGKMAKGYPALQVGWRSSYEARKSGIRANARILAGN